MTKMAAFRIGISSWAYSWAIGVPGYEPPASPLDCFALLEKAAELGADVLQLADNIPWPNLSDADKAALGRKARSHGVTLEVGTAGLVYDILAEAVDAARLMGAGLIRTLPHRGDDIPGMDEARRRLGGILPLLREHDLYLAIENHDHYPASWIRDLVVDMDDPHIGVCLDPVNNLGQGESEREVLSILGSRTINFHCKDYRIDRISGNMGFSVLGVPAGTGMLKLDRALQILRPGISWIVELWTPWQGESEKTVELEERWARESMVNLKALRDR